MTLHVHVLEQSSDAPRGSRIARKADDLVPLNELLTAAQTLSGQDEHLYLTNERLLTLIPRPSGGLIEIHRPKNILAALEAAYGPLPTGITFELAERWLAPPHPEGIPVLQLLLARVLEMPELERPGAVAPITKTVEAVVRAGAALEVPLVREAWEIHGPPDAVGTAGQPGPLRDTDSAPAVLAARLIAGYPATALATVLEATNWRVRNAKGLAAFAQALEVPDPRVLGPERLASLTALLRPLLETLPLDDYLAVVSGRLGVELEVLLARLDRDETAAALPTEAIHLRFSWLLQVDPPLAARFERFADAHTIAADLTVPSVSAETTEEAQAGLTTWVDFFTRRFLPALATWRRQGRPRDGALARALFVADAAFARWIAGAYPKLKGLPRPPLAYREIRRRCRAGPCVVLIVDGLSYELVDILREEALAAGIWMSKVEPSLASLPTVTDVGMLTAVAGLPADAASPDDAWHGAEARRRREELLRQREPGAAVRAVFQVDQIEETLKTPSSLYLLVWSDIDSAGHRYADPEMFMDHARISLRHVLRAIARAVGLQPHLKQQEDQLQLLISSDHGWTDLLQIEPVSRPEVDGARGHHRLYEVPRDMNPDEIAALGPQWIAIGGAGYDLPGGRTYLLPAENRPIERGVARQHGGLSLCEVLVPIGTAGFVRRAYRGLAIAAIGGGTLQKEREGEIRLVLSNRNEGTLCGLRITCRNLDLRAEIDHVPAQSSATFGPFPVCPRVSGPIDLVEVLLSYEGSTIGPQELRLEAPLQAERSLEERMAGDYSGLDRLLDEAG